MAMPSSLLVVPLALLQWVISWLVAVEEETFSVQLAVVTFSDSSALSFPVGVQTPVDAIAPFGSGVDLPFARAAFDVEPSDPKTCPAGNFLAISCSCA